MAQPKPDCETVVRQHPADLFEPVLSGMLAEVKRKESERLREHRERLRAGAGVSGASRT
ncbi:MAG: hypothetical protein ACYCU8_05975 [Ferrimicrobium acidiphilum]